MGIITWDEMPILWDAERAKETQGCLPTHRKRWFVILMSCLTAFVAVSAMGFVMVRHRRREARLRSYNASFKGYLIPQQFR